MVCPDAGVNCRSNIKTLEPTALQTRRDDRRDAILDVAETCFHRDGYAATSMSTIAATLGGSKGTLYNYFKSKDELFEAFVGRARQRLTEVAFEPAMTSELGTRDKLTALARAFLGAMISPQAMALHRLVIAESARFPEIGRAFYKAGPQIALARLAQIFEGLMEAGEIRRADPQVTAYQFKDLAVSGVYQLRLWGVIDDLTEAEIAERAETVMDTFMRAYAP